MSIRLTVRALFEWLGVTESIDSWQRCRTARLLAACDHTLRIRPATADFEAEFQRGFADNAVRGGA